MLALVEITKWHWTAFVIGVLIFLALDLGVFHREAHVVRFREALAWTTVFFTLAMCFAWWLRSARGKEDSLLFVTGYLVELSLSMDNVFVIALIFSYFRVPREYQHRVLFWGILGALVMRGAMIGAGSALVNRFHWMLYVFGGFLLFTGIKMLFASDEGIEPEKNPVIRLARRFFPVSPHFEGQKFLTFHNGRKALTPLALVLLMVETTDLIFAVDSIPAIFAITTDPFLVFTSNVFAILGLRSLYFVLANAIDYFAYLKIGLSLVLVFIGGKMLLPLVQKQFDILPGFKLAPAVSLWVVVGIIGTSVIASVLVKMLRSKKDSH